MDVPCRRIGDKCGINMIFNLVNETLKENSCFLRCDCEREFVEKDDRCVRSSILKEKTMIFANDSTTTNITVPG